MHFAIINPARQETSIVDCVSLHDAYLIAGLSPLKIDHGMVCNYEKALPGLAIVVYEYSLYIEPSKQSYFAINRKLYAGVAVLYAFNKEGETVSLPGVPPVSFFPNAQAVERNIALGLIGRPQIEANGVVLWQWPGQNPLGVHE